MTIAGSDPSGGAGIQADLKTFTLLGCYGQAVTTCLTVQNSCRVYRSEPVDAGLVYDQIAVAMSDNPPRAVKIGIVPNTDIAEAIVEALVEHHPEFVVYDPVLVSSSGLQLVDEESLGYIKHKLMPLATLVTPNKPEAECLAEGSWNSPEELATCLAEEVGTSVLLKGGHLDGRPVDTLCHNGELTVYDNEERVLTNNTHGTGCVLSSAIAANLAREIPMEEAVGQAKAFLTRALTRGADYFCGKKHGGMYLLPD